MRTDLDQIESEIPKGAFWMTGKFMRRVLQAIRKERRFAALNGGITEQPTKDGYAMSATLAGKTVKTYYIRNGALVTYQVVTTSGPTAI